MACRLHYNSLEKGVDMTEAQLNKAKQVASMLHTAAIKAQRRGECGRLTQLAIQLADLVADARVCDCRDGRQHCQY